MYVIECPILTPTNNEMMRKYANRHAKARKRDETIAAVRAVLPLGARNAAVDCCEVTVTRYGRNLVDWDNLGGGLKFVLDALVHWKVIADDSPRIIRRMTMQQEIDRRLPRVRVEIVPLLAEC